MKITAPDALRMAIYAIVMFFIKPLIFCGFNWLCVNGLFLFFDLKSTLSSVTFWLLFLVIGLSIIYLIRYIFAFVAIMVVNLFSKICPIWHYKFSERYIIALCIITIAFLMYGFYNGKRPDFTAYISGVILLWANTALARDLVKGLKSFHNIIMNEILLS